MTNFIVIYDACVLYPAPLRDLLMNLALTDLFQARWTEAIHDEWIAGVLRSQPALADRLQRTRKLMNAAVPDSLVRGYEPLIDRLTLPDQQDRHVLAAAIKGGAKVIVTFNLKDFPNEKLAPWEVKAQHPDAFVMHLINLSPGDVCMAMKAHRASLRRPVKTVAEYLAALQMQKLSKTAAALDKYAHRI